MLPPRSRADRRCSARPSGSRRCRCACRLRGSFEGAEVLHPVGDEIESVDVAAVGVLDPHLVVAVGAFDRDMPSWPASVSHSLGVVHTRNFSLFLSNFAMALWYITPTQGLSSRSISRSSVPSEPSRLDHGNRILRHLAGLRSILRGTSGRSRSTRPCPRDRASRRAAGSGDSAGRIP